MRDIGSMDYSNFPRVALKLFADWCGPCKRLSPLVDAIAQESDIPFFAVNIETSPEIASKYKVKGVPSLLFLRYGEEVDRITGVATREQIEEKLELL